MKDAKIFGCNLATPMIKYRNLKDEYTAILQKHIGSPATKAEMADINEELYCLFEHFELKDLQFRLQANFETGMAAISGIRKIDQLALLGIMNLE